MAFDGVVLVFALGVFARLVRSDLRLPEALYETLSIYLLLAIGLKGGVELSRQPLEALAPQVLACAALGFTIPLLLFPALRALRLQPLGQGLQVMKMLGVCTPSALAPPGLQLRLSIWVIQRQRGAHGLAKEEARERLVLMAWPPSPALEPAARAPFPRGGSRRGPDRWCWRPRAARHQRRRQTPGPMACPRQSRRG